MNSDDPLANAIREWQHKHRIADDDPVIAILDLVRLQLQHARSGPDALDGPPSFEDFRGTIELLDRRSKTLINQATDLTAELRRFALSVARINGARVFTQFVLLLVGAIIGAFLARMLW